MSAPTQPVGGLEGYSVLVTGGGTGIGKACAARLAQDGAAVTICGRRENLLQDAAAQVQQVIDAAGTGGRIQYLMTDVTAEADVARLVDSAVDFGGGRLDGCVANAGGGGGMGPYHLQNTDEFIRVLNLNVLGTLFLVKACTPHLVANGGGSFAGIEQMMRNAADEYGPTRVRFNAIRPGFISTEIMEGIPRNSPVYDSYIENTPMEDVGEPEDVAALARFLIGPDSRWITGQLINVDGGHSLRRGPNFGAFIEPALGRDVMLARRAPGQG